MIDRLNMHRKASHTILVGSRPRPAPAFVPTPEPSAPRPAPTAKIDVPATLLSYEELAAGRVSEKSTTPGEPGVYRAGEGVPTGAFAIVEEDLWYVCPCGCRQLSWVPFCLGKKEDRSWLFNGNPEAPVLSPSIAKRYGCRWHGFLGAHDGSKPGVWTTC